MHWSKTIVVRTVDTDVIVILAGVFFKLTATNPLADIGLPLVQERISDYIVLLPSVLTLVRKEHEHYQYFML